MKDLKVPCADCPFTRTVTPGALGGSRPAVYIGQSIGPFMLPCHKACDFDDPNWKDKIAATSQCAGAAIYRSNIGVEHAMPSGIHTLPADHEKVFSSHAEFLAHHTKTSVTRAAMLLGVVTPTQMMWEQMGRQDNRFVKKEEKK